MRPIISTVPGHNYKSFYVVLSFLRLVLVSQLVVGYFSWEVPSPCLGKSNSIIVNPYSLTDAISTLSSCPSNRVVHLIEFFLVVSILLRGLS